MNQLTSSRAYSEPQDRNLVVDTTLSLPPRDARLLELLTVDGEYPAGTPILDDDRQKLQQRADRLVGFGRDRREAGELRAIGAVLMLPRQSDGDDAADVLLQVFRRAVDGIPTWAIERAADEWIQGKHGGKFGPGPNEFAITARGIAERPAIMAARLAKAAVAPVAKPVDYERRRQFAEQVLSDVVWAADATKIERQGPPDAEIRGRWEADMCFAMAARPELLEPYQAIVAASPDLIERANAAERNNPRTGWAAIAWFVSQDFIKAERARLDQQERDNAAA